MDVVAPAHDTDRCAVVDGSVRGLVHRLGPTLGRLIRFGLVGALGTVLNTLVFTTATGNGLPTLGAAFLSMEIATGFNFAVSDRTVFAGRARSPRWARTPAFFAVATAGFLVTGPLMLALIAVSVPPVAANLVAVGALVLLRFVIADRLIWTAGPPPHGCRTVTNPFPVGQHIADRGAILPAPHAADDGRDVRSARQSGYGERTCRHHGST